MDFISILQGQDSIEQTTKGAKLNIEDYLNEETLEGHYQVFFLNQISGIMTGLGILFTFIGLSIGLNSFDLSGNAAEIEEKIGPLMDGIKVAFHTSICGLVYSLIFNIYYKKVNSVFEESLGEFLDTFDRYVIKKTDNASSNTLMKYQEMMCNSLDEQIATQKVLNAGVERQAKAEERLNEIILSDMPVMMSESVGEIIGPQIDRLSTVVENFAANTRKDQSEELGRIVDEFINQMNTSLGDSFSSLAATIEETNQWQKKTMQEMEVILSQINDLAYDLGTINSELQNSVVQLSAHENNMKEMQEQMHTNMDLMTGRIDLNTESIGKQNDLLNTVISGQHQTEKDMLSFLHSIENYMKTLETLQSDNKDKIVQEFQTLSELAHSICSHLYESTDKQAKELNTIIEQFKSEDRRVFEYEIDF